MDLKHRAIQVWGYFALIIGWFSAIVQVLALISPRRHYFPFFVLMAALAVYLIYIGRRSIAGARRSDPSVGAVTLSAEQWTFWSRSSTLAPVLRTKLAGVGITKKVLLIALGVVQAIAGVLAFIFVGAWILAGAAYLGVGPGAVPALIFCLSGSVAGISIVVRPSVGACRAAAVWDVLVGLFFLWGALLESEFHPELFIVGAILLGLFFALIVPDAVE